VDGTTEYASYFRYVWMALQNMRDTLDKCGWHYII